MYIAYTAKLSSIHALKMTNRKKGMHLATAEAKATAARAIKRKSGGDINDCVEIHHEENTNGAGNIQAPATLAVTDANTHNANAHGHSTMAVIS